jgi:hypothetical protein
MKPTVWEKLLVVCVVAFGTVAAIKLAMAGVVGVMRMCK